jgi:acetyltransferase
MGVDLTRALTFRRLRAGERRPILQLFESMSDRSRASRFHGAKRELSEGDLEQLAAVGCCGREAVVATDRATGRAVGLARYVVDHEGVAEVAYAVADDWQGRGVGRRLIVELARLADARGIDRFRALVASGNRPAIALLDHVGESARRAYDGPELEMTVAIRA